MSQNRETATDKLASIIQLIQLGRRSGTLTARRGEGITQEQGSITFLKGQITEASFGRHSGAEALNTLSAWGVCRFVFVSGEEADSLPLSPLPVASPERTGDTGSLPRQTSLSSYPGPITALPASNGHSHIAQNGFSGAFPGIPYRLHPLDSALRMIENLGLSRAHRRLLLLIDGQRSMAELERLTGKTGQEVAELLRDLKQAGVIRNPGSQSSPHQEHPEDGS